MRAPPKVSIILPIYKPSGYLRDCFQSILKQSYSNFEIIVVDDGSGVQSQELILEIINGVDNVFFYHFDKNFGVAHARNFGVSKARGEYICFIDQDDFWSTDKLKNQEMVLQKNPDIDYTAGRQHYFLSSDIATPPSWVRPDFLGKSFSGYLPGALMVRATSFARIGGFNEALKAGTDDVDWFFRAKDQGLIGYLTEEDVLYKRVHENNLSERVRAHNAELLQVIAKSISRQKSGRQ